MMKLRAGRVFGVRFEVEQSVMVDDSERTPPAPDPERAERVRRALDEAPIKVEFTFPPPGRRFVVHPDGTFHTEPDAPKAEK